MHEICHKSWIYDHTLGTLKKRMCLTIVLFKYNPYWMTEEYKTNTLEDIQLKQNHTFGTKIYSSCNDIGSEQMTM